MTPVEKRAKFVHELRHTKRKQLRHNLGNYGIPDEPVCALGLWHAVFGAAGFDIGAPYHYAGEMVFRNNTGHTFAEIADWLETLPLREGVK